MKINLLFVLVCLFCTTNYAQQNYKYEFQDKCGSPEVESQIYVFRSGKVLKINADNTILVKDKTGKKWIVELAGIDLNQNKDEVKQILTNKLLSQTVEFSGNPEKRKSNNIEAIVNLDDFEVNRYLIEKGFSKYKSPDYGYSVSRYKLCSYVQLEETARKTKLGIWVK